MSARRSGRGKSELRLAARRPSDREWPSKLARVGDAHPPHETTLDAFLGARQVTLVSADDELGNARGRPTTILDRNAFQGLSAVDHRALREAFHVVHANTLVHEIAGVMEKGREYKGKTQNEKLRELATKFLGDVPVLKPWTMMCAENLGGAPVDMNGEPVLFEPIPAHVEGTGEPVYIMRVREDGSRVSVYRDWVERVAEGQAQPDVPLRERGTPAHVELRVRGRLAGIPPKVSRPRNVKRRERLPTLERSVVAAVHKFLRARRRDARVAHWIVESFDIREPRARARAFRDVSRGAWRAAGRPALADYAPYAHFCARVDLLYLVGLDVWPKARELNDEDDLRYLKCLPFCRLFVSDDVFVRAMAEHLINASYQRLLTLQELREMAACNTRSP